MRRMDPAIANETAANAEVKNVAQRCATFFALHQSSEAPSRDAPQANIIPVIAYW